MRPCSSFCTLLKPILSLLQNVVRQDVEDSLNLKTEQKHSTGWLSLDFEAPLT